MGEIQKETITLRICNKLRYTKQLHENYTYRIGVLLLDSFRSVFLHCICSSMASRKDETHICPKCWSVVQRMTPSPWQLILKFPGNNSYILHFFKGKIQQHCKEFSTCVFFERSCRDLQTLFRIDNGASKYVLPLRFCNTWIYQTLEYSSVWLGHHFYPLCTKLLPWLLCGLA